MSHILVAIITYVYPSVDVLAACIAVILPYETNLQEHLSIVLEPVEVVLYSINEETSKWLLMGQYLTTGITSIYHGITYAGQTVYSVTSMASKAIVVSAFAVGFANYITHPSVFLGIIATEVPKMLISWTHIILGTMPQDSIDLTVKSAGAFVLVCIFVVSIGIEFGHQLYIKTQPVLPRPVPNETTPRLAG